MKNISCDLIDAYIRSEKLIEQSDERPEDIILNDSCDGLWLNALSRDRMNIVEWYPWNRKMSVLQVGAAYGAFSEISERVDSYDIRDTNEDNIEFVRLRSSVYLDKNGGNISLGKYLGNKKYDVVFVPELTSDVIKSYGGSYEKLINELLPNLKPHGNLIISAENMRALKFSTGAEMDPDMVYVDRNKTEKIFSGLGFERLRWYYPIPDPSFAKEIYSDEYMPGKGAFRNIADSYISDRYELCDEASVYGVLTSSGAFKEFAPSYLMIFENYCAIDSEVSDDKKSFNQVLPVYIRYNRNRLSRYAIKTEIFFEENKKYVLKTALTTEANEHIDSFKWKYELLKSSEKRGLHVLKPEFSIDSLGRKAAAFKYLKGETLSDKYGALINEGRAPEGKIKASLDIVLGTAVEECHNLDIVLENIMINEYHELYLLDYEWVFENSLDREYVVYRALRYWYEPFKESLYAYKNMGEFMAAFGIKPYELGECEVKEASFQKFVFGEDYEDFEKRFRKKIKTVADIKGFEEKLDDMTEWNLRLQDEVNEHKTALKKVREVERLSQNHIKNIEAINAAQQTELERIRTELEYLRKHEGIVSRLYRRLKRVFNRFFPVGSKKRKVINYIRGTILNPIKYCKLYFTKEGRNYISGDFSIGGEFSEGGKLILPKVMHLAKAGENAEPEAEQGIRPLVSIIIPVYNQVNYTYACIRSIIEHTDFEKTPYEIILADDVSTDATGSIGRYIENLVISRNSENQGFLKNCNQAAKLAAGKYIFFLNNDTKVTDGWLSSLVELISSDESIGMVGSKLVYPDGRLQEAGGIIWSDASGWNYGRLDDPSKPQYNYVKDVDYISGAAIMLSRELWKEIGGFDERFAPAYCEDSDLAFEVRKRGKRVVLQPKSVVVHFEGISNGTDVEGSGLKRYQLVNQTKFKEKWAKELKDQSENTGNPNPFSARERSQKKPVVLVIDHYVPTWDKDAGSRTTYQYIKMFIRMGYQVKFMGDNFLHEEPYSGKLQQKGVEILYGSEMQENCLEWIKQNQEFIDVCYLNRPHIAIKYIDFIKENTNIKCIYYGHDLHFLRLRREYELNGDIRTKREADYWKSVEFSVMEKADMVYYPSQNEIDAIHELRPDIPAKAITAYVWDEFESHDTDYSKREGILFVGGFAHPPNEDGVLWFAQKILPKIKEQIPDIKFYIAGSKAGDNIKALSENDSSIEVLGFVSDERLLELYNETKMVVVPLRYGAGVKGKVVEALYNGAVIVTTSVGAEGIPYAENVMAISDENEADIHNKAEEVERRFADEVIRLYSDDLLLGEISKNTESYIRKYYSMDAAWKTIRGDFCG